MQPTGYREWIYIGTPLTPNDLNPPEAPFPEFHNVYIHPDDFDHYRRTGLFPDGTVLIKELARGFGGANPSNLVAAGNKATLHALVTEPRHLLYGLVPRHTWQPLSRMTVCRWPPLIRCIFCIPPEPPVCPKGWCATTAGTWWL